jgi:hypothetical protein
VMSASTCPHGVDTHMAWCRRCADPEFDAAQRSHPWKTFALFLGLITLTIWFYQHQHWIRACVSSSIAGILLRIWSHDVILKYEEAEYLVILFLVILVGGGFAAYLWLR